MITRRIEGPSLAFLRRLFCVLSGLFGIASNSLPVVLFAVGLLLDEAIRYQEWGGQRRS